MTDDTAPLEDAAVRWLANAEALAARKDLPIQFLPFVEIMVGAGRQQVRLAREIDTMRRTGALVVEVTADRAARRLIEAG